MEFKRVFSWILIFCWVNAAGALADPSALNAKTSDTRSANVQTTSYSRIITLAPVLAEWTSEILGENLTKKKLIAVSEYSVYPKSLSDLTTIGAYFKLNIEKIAALKPDLVIASSEYNRPEQLEQLKRLKLPVEILPAEKFSEMPKWIKTLGKVLQSDSTAAIAASRWGDEVKALELKKNKNPETFFLEVQHSPLVTIGGESFLNEAFGVMGYENIFKALPQAYPKVSKESVMVKKPKNIFILDLTGNPKDFDPAVMEWEKFGFRARVLSGDDFARCSFSLLKGLRAL